MKFIPITDKTSLYYRQTKALYNQSFPILERKPFTDIMTKVKRRKMDLYALEDNNSYIGFIEVAHGNTWHLLDYFAIHPSLRSKGYGSYALKQLLDMYNDLNLVIEIERSISQDDQAYKRRLFYLNNGCKTSNVFINLYHVDYELLTNNKPITFDEYIQCYCEAFGHHCLSYLKPKQIF